MRISDWSSDVCSSDLIAWVNSHWLQIGIAVGVGLVIYILLSLARRFALKLAQSADGDMSFTHIAGRVIHKTKSTVIAIVARSESRGVGKACVIRCRYQWPPRK